MSSLTQLRELLETQQTLLDTCNEVLELDPTDAETLQEKSTAQATIKELNAKIAALSGGSVAPPPPPPSNIAPPPPPAPEKPHVHFDVGERILAFWKEDKAFYKATIVSKTGSSSNPFYTVRFIEYDDVITVGKDEVKALESKKRKADAQAAAENPAPHRTVITAAPAIVQKKEPSKVSDGPTRMKPEPKKLKQSKALEKAKSNWNAWQQKGATKKGAAPKGGSQFRTTDAPKGGAKKMKEQAKSTWDFGRAQVEGDDEDDPE